MTIESLRDIVIIIFGIVNTICLIIVLIVGFLFYKRVSAIQILIMGTVAELQKAIAETKEAIKPIAQVAAIIDAVRNGVDLVSKIQEMKKGGKGHGQGSVD